MAKLPSEFQIAEDTVKPGSYLLKIPGVAGNSTRAYRVDQNTLSQNGWSPTQGVTGDNIRQSVNAIEETGFDLNQLTNSYKANLGSQNTAAEQNAIAAAHPYDTNYTPEERRAMGMARDADGNQIAAGQSPATADNRGLGNFTGITNPNAAGVAVNPVQQALTTAQASGPAPQNSGEARGAVSNFMPGLQAPGFYKPTTPVSGYDPQTVFDSSGKPLSYDQYIAAGGKADFSNVQAGSPPQGGGQVSAATVGSPVSANTATSAVVDQQLAQDPLWQQFLADKAEYSSVANQTKSLLDTYNQLSSQLGIQGLNTQLLNAERIINGTEDDIRSEVQAVGGFATDSQVQALANARNKTLVQNYNNLLATKKMAMETLDQMTTLASQDRQFALNTIEQKLRIDQQMMEYRDKFINNAQEGYNSIIKTAGMNGLYAALQADPKALSTAEKTLGLAPGGLARLAALSQPDPSEEKQYELSQGEALVDSKGNVIYRNPVTYKGTTTTTNSPSSPKYNPVNPRGNTPNNITPENDLPKGYPTTGQVDDWITEQKQANPNMSYDELWGELAEGLQAAGVNPTDFDKNFWKILHPEGLTGYQKYVVDANKKTTSGTLDKYVITPEMFNAALESE